MLMKAPQLPLKAWVICVTSNPSALTSTAPNCFSACALAEKMSRVTQRTSKLGFSSKDRATELPWVPTVLQSYQYFNIYDIF